MSQFVYTLVMDNNQKCHALVALLLLLFLLCQSGDGLWNGLQSPLVENNENSEIFYSEEHSTGDSTAFEYKYEDDEPLRVPASNRRERQSIRGGQRSSNSWTSGSTFGKPGQTTYQQSSGKERKNYDNTNSWNSEFSFGSNMNGGSDTNKDWKFDSKHNEPKTEGYRELSSFDKTTGSYWNSNSNNNKNSWDSNSKQNQENHNFNVNFNSNFGFQNDEPRTEGYRGSGFSANNNNMIGNTWNSNANTYSGSMNSNSKKNYGNSNSNSFSNWKSDSNNDKTKTQGSKGFEAQPSKDSAWSSNLYGNENFLTTPNKNQANKAPSTNWNFGLQNNKHQGNAQESGFNSSKNISGNSWDNNKKGNDKKDFVDTKPNWNSGFYGEIPRTEGYSDSQIPFYKNKSANANTNGWNSDSDWKNQRESNVNRENSTKPIQNFQSGGYRPNDFVNSFKNDTGKPGSLSGNLWGPSSKPDYNSNKPSKEFPSENQANSKGKTTVRPVTQTTKPEKKLNQINWEDIEKENKPNRLVLDMSQLWYPSDRKTQNRNPAENSDWPKSKPVASWKAKKRDTSDELTCDCRDEDDCDPGDKVDVMDFFNADFYRLRSAIMECSMQNKICCIVGSSKFGKVPVNLNTNQVNEYQAQVANLRPNCGRRVTEIAASDKTPDGLADYGDFSWIIRFFADNDDEDNEESICSGSLIHSSIALTSAQCALLLSGGNIRVKAGEWNTGSGHGRNRIQETGIGKIFLHPKFDIVNYSNDIALVFLEEAFDTSLGTSNVCLPSSKDAWDSSRCVVVGWSKEYGHGLEEPVLRKTDLSTITQGKCKNFFNNKQHDIPDADFDDSHYICAHSSSMDPCMADVGSSLMCPLYNSNMFVQIGFLTQAVACNHLHKTAVFSDILQSLSWITHMEGTYLYFTSVDFTRHEA